MPVELLYDECVVSDANVRLKKQKVVSGCSFIDSSSVFITIRIREPSVAVSVIEERSA